MDLWSLVPFAWRSELAHVRGTIDHIGQSLEHVSRMEKVLPLAHNIFRALALDPADVQVVIVGQDPYPNARHACGLSFSVPPGTHPLPASLRNILKEVSSDTGSTRVSDGDLQPWSDQGVMLINRVLTVSQGKPDSHKSLGWTTVTDAIANAVVQHNPQVPAILWGKSAQEMTPIFKQAITGVHPSPLSAYRGFFGSRPFSAVNAVLENHDKKPIGW